jgi:hypothetical protein
MDKLQKKLKENREFRWERFNESDAEEKLLRLQVIIAMKAKEEQEEGYHLAVNLRNFGSNFDSIIFELISKAQSTPDNYYRLMLAFPEYVKLWEEWQNTEDEKEFFKKYLSRNEDPLE